MREDWQRAEKRPKPRTKERGRRDRFHDEFDRISSRSGERRKGRKRQLEELTELEMDEMLDLAEEGETQTE